MKNYIVKIASLILLYGCNSNDLGNKLTIFEGDKLEDRVIVYCTGYDFGSCKSGIYVVPTFEKHYDENGNYLEYVESVKFDNNWVIVKTFRIINNTDNYWIINKGFSLENINCEEFNCDSIIQSHVIGPMNRYEFLQKKKELGIILNF